MSSNTEDCRFLVSFKDATDFDGRPRLEINACVVLMDDGNVRNPSDDPFRNAAAWAADFAFDSYAGLTDDGFGMWRMGPEYRSPYRVDLERAEMMVKTLRKVKRGLDRITAELGPAQSFAQQLARVASVMGVKTFGWVRDTGRSQSWWDDCEFHWTDAVGIVFHIDHKLSEWKRTKAPVAT